MKAIVVGSGFGGMAAALRLKAKGYHVTLIERGTQLGGRARVFKQDGFQFDAGPTVITAPYLIDELFTPFGKRSQDYLTLKKLDHWYRYLFQDGRQFDYVGNPQQLYANIASFRQGDVEGFKRLQALSKRLFDKGFTELGDKPFANFQSIMRHTPALMKLKFYNSVYRTVSAHIKDEHLRRVFTTQPLLVGGDPFKTTSIYLLILHLEQAYGCHFSMGGTHSIVKALERLMQEQGVEIIKQCTVTHIDSDAAKVKGVVTDTHGRLKADLVVYNGDPAYAYHHLIDKQKHQSLINLKRLKYSMSMCLFYFGTKRKYNHVQLHTILYGNAYKKLLSDIFHKHQLNMDLSLYLYRPTAHDQSLAPEGCDSFYALAPVPNLLSNTDWQQEQAKVRARIIELLEPTMPNLANEIVTEKMLTPNYFADDLLSMHGAGFSIQPIFTQSAYFRFHNQSKKVKGLYFVGAGTHPGAGVPGVLSSAKLIDGLIPHAA